LEAVAITAAPTRIKDVAKALLNLVPMTFTLVGTDPKLASLIESSDYHYSITDQLKIMYHTELKSEVNVDNSVQPPKTTVSFHFQYLRPNIDKLKEAVGELCRYVTSKGANLERVDPPELEEPETKPFDQDKSNFYGQNSVTQPYHTPAQIAAAAQGTLPMYQLGNHNYHQNGGYHHHNNMGSMNGYHNYSAQSFGRGGYPAMQSGSFGMNRAVNAVRGGHHNVHSPPPSYQNGFQQFQPQGRGSHANHGHFNPQYGPVGGVNGHMNGSNGYHRGRYVHTPPTPSGDVQLGGANNLNYQSHSRAGGIASGMVVQSPLDTLPSLELPDMTNQPNGNDYRTSQEGHTPLGGPFSPPTQSYFPSQPGQPHHNGFPHGQGYPGGSNPSRYQG